MKRISVNSNTHNPMSKKNLLVAAFIAIFLGYSAARLNSIPWSGIVAFAPFLALFLFTDKVHFLRGDGWLPRLLIRTAPARSLLEIHDKTARGGMLDTLLRFAFVFALLCWPILVLKLWPA